MKKVFPVFLLTGFCYLISGICLYATDVSGIISSDTTWTVAGSPYIITGNVLVEQAVALRIDPGVTVKFSTGTYLRIDGSLKAEGSEANHIIFTSNKATPAPGDWQYIKFTDASDDSQCVITYCEIKYAGQGIYYEDSCPTIKNSAITNNSRHGIYGTGSAVITNNTISNNGECGIYSSGASVISNNTISDNGVYGIHCKGSPMISANKISSNICGIYCCMDSSPKISYNTISNNDEQGIYIEWANAEIFRNTIINNGTGESYYNYCGIYCYGYESNISSNTITGNSNGITIEWGPPSMSKNNIYGNTNYNAYNNGTSDVAVPNNWWGTTDTDEIEAKIYDYYDDFEKGKIIYQPFATQPFAFGQPSRITDLSASPGTGEGEIILSWTAPGNDGTEGTAICYSIRYFTTEITESNWESISIWKDTRPVSGPYGTPETETMTGLMGGTTYYFGIKAQNNMSIWSALSNSASSCSPSIPPGAIVDLAASTGQDDGEIDLQWTAPGDDGYSGMLPSGSKFRIDYSTQAKAWSPTDYNIEISTSDVSPGMGIGCTVSDLIGGAIYYFCIWTCDELENWSEKSNIASAKVKVTAPLSPTGFRAIKTGTTTITWAWWDNAVNEAGYKVIGSGYGEDVVSPILEENTTFWTETGLSSNASYSRYVLAYNVAGQATSHSATVYTLASVPTGLTVLAKSTTTITLSWSGNGTEYEVRRSSEGVNYFHIAQTELCGYLDSGLSHYTVYYYRVRAYNGDDIATAPSDAISVRTKDTPPEPPSEVRDGSTTDIDFTCSSTTLSANWTASSDPETGIEKYWYAIGTNPAGTDIVGWKDNESACSATETGLSLEQGKKYYFSVKAENGLGLLSEVVSSDGILVDLTPPTGKPGTPQDRGAYGGETIGFFWTEGTVSDPESGIAGYQLQVTTNQLPVTSYDVEDVLGYGVPNCEDGKTYYARVRAKNGAGLYGDWSALSDGIICDTVPPEKPTETEICQTQNSIIYTGQTEEEAHLKWVIIEDQRGDVLEVPADASVDASGRISINLDLQEILSKYPLTTQIKIEIRVEDRAGNPSEIVSSSMLRITPGENDLICYNNVFNPGKGELASIIYKLVEPGEVYLEIFDSSGEKLKIILDSYRAPGCYEEVWNGQDRNNQNLGSGIYLVLFRTGGKKYIKKIAIVK